MSSRNLVICGREEGYISAFAEFLAKKKELAFQVHVCSEIPQVQEVMKNSPVDILLIDEGYPEEERKNLKAGAVFLFTETERPEIRAEETLVYKYQSGESILTEIICRCSKKEGAGELFFHTAKTGRAKMIGIFSPVHRSGKTGYGLQLGQKLAVSKNVLYLNLELYGGIGGYFPEEGHTLADALYYSRQESKNAGLLLPSLVKHMGPLDYLLPVKVSEDIKAVSQEEWTELFRQIGGQSIYDVLILDIDEGLRDVYGLLRMCTEIHVPVIGDQAANAKLLQLEAELHLLGYEDVKKKMVKKELAYD